MYTTAAKVRALLRDYVSADIDDTAITLISDTYVVPWINAALNGGSTISAPSALVIAIDSLATACKTAQAVYAKKDTQAPDKVKQWCEEAKQMVRDIREGLLSDATVSSTGGILAADPADEMLEETIFVTTDPLNWLDRDESRA